METNNRRVGLKEFLASGVKNVIEKQSPWVNKELGIIPNFLNLQHDLFNLPTAKEITENEGWQDIGASNYTLLFSDENYDEVFKNLSLEIMKTWPVKKAELNSRTTKNEKDFIKVRKAIVAGDEEFELAEQYLNDYREFSKIAQKFHASIDDLILVNVIQEQKALKRVIGENLDTPIITSVMKSVLYNVTNSVPTYLPSLEFLKRLPSMEERLYMELLLMLYKECHALNLRGTDEGTLEKLKSRFINETKTNTYSEVEHDEKSI